MADAATAGQSLEKVWLASNDNVLIDVGTPSQHLRRGTQSCTEGSRLAEVTAFLDRDVIERSVLIKDLLGDTDARSTKEAPIPIPNVRTSSFDSCHNLFAANSYKVNEAVLRKVLKWCERHRNDPLQANDEDLDSRKKSNDIDDWDRGFIQVDQEMLFEIILVQDPHIALPR